MMYMFFKCLLILITLGSLPLFAAQPPSSKIEKEYKKLLVYAQIKSNPDRHLKMATWCRGKGWTEQAEYHQIEFNKHTFQKANKKLKSNASIADFKRMFELAKRLKLDTEADAMRTRWMAAELTIRRSKLKPGDAAGYRALLDWVEKEGAATGEAVEQLAKKLLTINANDERAHQILGHLKDGEKWVDPWSLLVKRGGLKDVKVRYAIHKQIDEQGSKQKQVYSKTPLAGVEKVAPAGSRVKCLWKGKIRGLGDGQGNVFTWMPAHYNPAKPWPLLIYLHGGGAGGVPAALNTASNNLGPFAWEFPKTNYIVIAPAVRIHPINAWNVKENMLDVVDAIIDTCKRFHIDKKRIYLWGSSMGAQGTSRFSWVVPELFAAFSPQAGAYWNKHPVPDLTGKPFLVLHGAKDAGFRNKTLKEFLAKIKKANADVKYINYPDAGHGLPTSKVIPEMLSFFDKHTNDFAPDLRLARKLIAETVTEKPHGSGKKKRKKKKTR